MKEKKVWKKLGFTANDIVHETTKATLMRIPKSNGYMFWHVAKLVRRTGYHIDISFTDDFEFNVFRRLRVSDMKYELTDQQKLSAEKFVDFVLKKSEFDNK